MLHGWRNDQLTTEWVTESIDFGDKSASQCDAMAFKQMLIHTFLIPTDMKDPDDSPAKEVVNNVSEFRGDPNKPVTIPQLKRLRAIAGNNGWSDQDIKDHLLNTYDLDSSKKLNMGQYNEICKEIQESKKDKS